MLNCTVDDWSKRVRRQTGLPMKSLSVELTRKCNFLCKHCFLVNPKPEETQTTELSYNEWVDIFDQYSEMEGLFLTITGGEPLLRPDFKDLWIYLKKKGFLLTLFTNGSLIDEEMADFLAEWTPLEVSITLYGASEETYRKVTGHKNVFRKVVNGLDYLKGKGLSLEVKGVFSKLNVNDFHQVRDLSKRYCDVFRWDMALLGSYPSSQNNPVDIRLTPEEYAEIEFTEPGRKKQLDAVFQKWEPENFMGVTDNAFTCNVASGSSVHIDSKGIMHPCLVLENAGYDVVNGSLQEGWHEAIPAIIRNYPFQQGACQTCAAAEVCAPCAAFAELEGCSVTGPVPYKCKLTQARAKLFDFSEVMDNILQNNTK